MSVYDRNLCLEEELSFEESKGRRTAWQKCRTKRKIKRIPKRGTKLPMKAMDRNCAIAVLLSRPKRASIWGTKWTVRGTWMRPKYYISN